MTVAETETRVPLEGFVGEVLKELGDAVIEVECCGARRGWARIDPERTVEVAETMLAMAGARLATATALDVRDGIDVLYHWAIEPQGVVVTLKVLAERPALAVDSIAGAVPAANWIEREMHDLLGANFRGHPDMRRLILDDSWPEGVYPLRKDFDQVRDRPPLPPDQTPPDVGRRERNAR
ncbi:MAG: NADH-quinone oxidoreductase subunit C [Planctomycetes bacterium]|nr:NADH-quinone oxidoreductase subunit C [Planctomycetota bacterium]